MAQESPYVHSMVYVVTNKTEADRVTAISPQLPGCIAEGDTVEDALEDFQRALAALKEAYNSEAMPVPWKHDVVLPRRTRNTRIFSIAVHD